ncbi:alpha/beta fold hydrolase [Candidatus Uhrbacteria bacterium]|nr:alpha/beta fold hydrolase [Candidatus Uhrbacteria bacterium]
MFTPVSFTTKDGVTIVGQAEELTQTRVALLLPMMPKTKESWEPFMKRLAEAHIGSLAIDLRGHGGSTMGGTLDYHSFFNKQHQESEADVQAALDLLTSGGRSLSDIVMVGASIGANLAILLQSRHPELRRVVALSPGLDFRGVVTEPAVKSLTGEQKLLLIASDDDEASYRDAQQLHELNHTSTVWWPLAGLGHGTNMFEADSGLMDRIIEWIL